MDVLNSNCYINHILQMKRHQIYHVSLCYMRLEYDANDGCYVMITINFQTVENHC